MERNDALRKLKSLAEPLLAHAMKLAIYEDSTGNQDHWISEIAEYLSIANDITIKPKSKKFNKSVYDQYLFGGFGDTVKDAAVNVRMFRLHNTKYPEFYPDKDMFARAYEVSRVIQELGSEYLTIRNDLDHDDIVHILRDRLL